MMADPKPLDHRPRRPSNERAHADKLGALHDRLTAEVAALRTGEDWQRWLAVAARFHTYSFQNTLLIRSQRPDATNVAGYETWKALGRQVSKGQKGIAILAPVLRRPRPDDDTGRGVGGARDARGRDGNSTQVGPGETEPPTPRVTGFRVAYVWDVAQTTGQPLPERPTPQLLSGQAPEGLWDALAAEVARSGFRLERGPCGGANGLTDFLARAVRVRDDVDDAQAAKTLAHELGHVGLHQPNADSGVLTCRGVLEVEAESVAYLITAAYGLDAGGYTFPYVATWGSSVPGQASEDVVRATGHRVLAAARLILDREADPDHTSEAGAAVRALAQLADRTMNGARATSGIAAAATPRRRPEAPPVARSASAAPRAPTRHTATGLGPRTTEPTRGELITVHQQAAAFFRDRVEESWVPDYLDRRGLAVGLEEAWSLGCAPRRWTALSDHLRQLGADDELLLASGLATRARTGRPVDRFRDRLMIPIRDPAGDVIGFVGRATPTSADDRAPRYLNSPETALYRKGNVLYGLSEGRAALQHGAQPVLVEGPLDAIAVTAGTEGRCVGVAACGTAVTAAHVDLLIRHADVRTRGLIVATDDDAAGHAAAARILSTLCERGITATAAALPAGSDPAGLLLRHGSAALTSALLDRRRLLADAVIDQRLAAWSDRFRWVEGRVAAVREVAQLVATLPADEISRQVRRVAEKAGVDVMTVQREVASWIGIGDARPSGQPALAAPSRRPAAATPARAANRTDSGRRRLAR